MVGVVKIEATRVGVLLGGGATQRKSTGEMAFHLAVLDLDAPAEPRSISLAFLAHGITPSPHDPRLLVLFEKQGPGCCVLDWSTGEVVRTLEAGPGRKFYGHGVFSADGELLYCTETAVDDRSKGYIAVRNARDFTLLGEFPSFGLAPHDCMLFDEGRVLVVANGGSAVGERDGPCVTYVDIAEQRLLERLDVPVDRLNAGHLAMTQPGDLALVSAPREGLDPDRSCGGISLRVAGGELRTVEEPRETTEQLLGETLSVAIHEETGIVGATTPLAHLVSFWSLATGELIETLRVPSPRGIALSLSGDEFIVNFGTPPRAARIDARTLEPVDAPGNRRGHLSLATGSHILMLEPLATG
jgi:uncharacterized protein